MIGIVCRPTERLLAHIAGAQHKTAAHQQQHTNTGLYVFEGQVGHITVDLQECLLQRIDRCPIVNFDTQRRMPQGTK